MRKKTFEIHRQIITNVYQITVHDRNSMVHRWSCAHQRSIAITRKKILTIPNALIYIIRMSSSSGQVIYERLNGDWNRSYNFSNKYFKYMCVCEVNMTIFIRSISIAEDQRLVGSVANTWYILFVMQSQDARPSSSSRHTYTQPHSTTPRKHITTHTSRVIQTSGDDDDDDTLWNDLCFRIHHENEANATTT